MWEPIQREPAASIPKMRLDPQQDGRVSIHCVASLKTPQGLFQQPLAYAVRRARGFLFRFFT